MHRYRSLVCEAPISAKLLILSYLVSFFFIPRSPGGEMIWKTTMTPLWCVYRPCGSRLMGAALPACNQSTPEAWVSQAGRSGSCIMSGLAARPGNSSGSRRFQRKFGGAQPLEVRAAHTLPGTTSPHPRHITISLIYQTDKKRSSPLGASGMKGPPYFVTCGWQQLKQGVVQLSRRSCSESPEESVAVTIRGGFRCGSASQTPNAKGTSNLVPTSLPMHHRITRLLSARRRDQGNKLENRPTNALSRKRATAREGSVTMEKAKFGRPGGPSSV